MEKKMYMIDGYTKSGNWVGIGACSTIEMCKEFFIKKYPRFNGKAKLMLQTYTYITETICGLKSGQEENVIVQFSKTSELK